MHCKQRKKYEVHETERKCHKRAPCDHALYSLFTAAWHNFSRLAFLPSQNVYPCSKKNHFLPLISTRNPVPETEHQDEANKPKSEEEEMTTNDISAGKREEDKSNYLMGDVLTLPPLTRTKRERTFGAHPLKKWSGHDVSILDGPAPHFILFHLSLYPPTRTKRL